MKIAFTGFFAFVFILILSFTNIYPQLANSPWPMFQCDIRHSGQSAYALPDSAMLAWQYKVDWPSYVGCQPIISEDGTIYFADDTYLHALLPDGTLKWSYTLGTVWITDIGSTPAIANDGTIYIGDGNGLTAINKNGSLKWSIYFSREFGDRDDYSSPVISPEGIIYIGSNNDTLYAINPEGTIKWSYGVVPGDEGWDGIVSSPAVGPDGTIYFATNGIFFYALKPNGTLKWKKQVFYGGGDHYISPCIGNDGTIYLDEKIALNPDGTFKWGTEGTDYVFTPSSPALGNDGTIYFLTADGLLAKNADGTDKWKYSYPWNSWLQYNSPIIDKNGFVCFKESETDKLHIINPDGTLNRIIDNIPGEENDFRGIAISSDGSFYITNFGISDMNKYSAGLYRFIPTSVGKVPDLIITEITVNPPIGSTPGGIIKINAKVKDVSGEASATCNVKFYYDDKTNFIGTASTTIPINDHGTASVEWETQNFDIKQYDIIAVISDSNPLETDISNNEAHFTYKLIPFIQPRISSAKAGETILVEPGTYFEQIFLKDSVIVKSTSGFNSTIIDGMGKNTVVSVSYNDTTAVIDGFTIRNGVVGIDFERGGGIVINNKITNNGTGIYMIGSMVYQDPIIKNNLIVHNGRATETNNSWAKIINNTIALNAMGVDGYGFYSSSPTYKNCIIWANGDDLTRTASATYSCIEDGDAGTGNINQNPLFVDIENDDFRLQTNSPCINAVDPDQIYNDDDSSRNDIGAYGGPNAMITGVEDNFSNTLIIPKGFQLFQNYPNPFNPITTIIYSIPNTSFVTLKVYDMLGKEIATLVNEEKIIGNYEIKFDGRNLSSGVYFYRMSAGKFVETKKLMLLK